MARTTDPIEIALVLTILLAIASIVSGCSYALCQGMEKQMRDRKGELMLSLLGTGLFAISGLPLLMLASYMLLTAQLLLLVFPVTMGSAWLHQKLGGASTSYSSALTVMLCTILMSFVGGATLLSILHIATGAWFQVRLSWSTDDSTVLYFWALYGYPQVVPIAAWIWRGFKPRPGVEVHLRKGEPPI